MPDLLGGLEFTWPFYAGFIVSYLIGSIPFALIFVRMAGLGDIREIGSGNIGASNVLRTGNKKIAALTLLFDLLKGLIPVVVAWQFGPDMPVFCALGAVLGHCFPIYLRFKGGKAVATAAGVILGLEPIVFALIAVTWLATAFTIRISSAAALAASAAAPAYAYWLSTPQLFEVTLAISALVIVRHHANINRILKGTEPKIGQKKPS